MAIGEIHVGDIGTVILITIQDENGNVVDVSTASQLEFVFEKPDGSLMTVDASKLTTGVDGQVYYRTLENDFDQNGIWRYQVYYSIGDDLAKHSDIGKFRVYANLPI